MRIQYFLHDLATIHAPFSLIFFQRIQSFLHGFSIYFFSLFILIFTSWWCERKDDTLLVSESHWTITYSCRIGVSHIPSERHSCRRIYFIFISTWPLNSVWICNLWIHFEFALSNQKCRRLKQGSWGIDFFCKNIKKSGKNGFIKIMPCPV